MLLSPLNTKLICCPLVLLPSELLLELLELDRLLEEDGRRSIHGTATCLPLLEERLLLELLESPEELEAVPEAEPLGLVPAPELLDPELPLALPGLSPLEEPEPKPEEELPGLLLPPVPPELSDRIAKSILPEAGLIIVSLIVPNVSPEEPVTFAPMS